MSEDAASTATVSRSELEEETEPIVYDSFISKKKWYFVFGEWSCLGCDNTWTHRRTKIRLSKFKDGINAVDLEDSERVGQQCRNCSSNESKLIKYTPLSPDDDPPVSEHLIWNDEKDDWYRVYGKWKCDGDGCNNIWTSAHTYILLSKYMARVPAANLISVHDYWVQDCIIPTCSTGGLTEYQHLRHSGMSKDVHKSSHCSKCRARHPC